jgi:GGDEF domain-containing protein
MSEHVNLTPGLDILPQWTSISINFDPTQFSVLGAFEQALTRLVGDAVYQLRPESTMNAAIVMLSAPVNGAKSHRRPGYMYRWYRMREMGPSDRDVLKHVRCPILFDEADLRPTDVTLAVQKRRAFVFDQPITLASAFLHHELQRRPDTKALLGEIICEDERHVELYRRCWANLDIDKQEVVSDCYIIRDPGLRYAELHRETFEEKEAAAGTVATFIRPVIVRGVLLGLFCVDVAHGRDGGDNDAQTDSSGWLNQFTEGLNSLGIGIEATLGACSKAYYTHLDPSTLPANTARGEPDSPILSAAFLETLMSEVEHRNVAALNGCAMGYLFFDNNDLKKVNTIGNYECGTEIIRATGEWITEGIREWTGTFTDTEQGSLRERLDNAPQFWLVRWGGDEFIAVIAGSTGAKAHWAELLSTIENVIHRGRDVLALAIAELPSLSGKTEREIEELQGMLRQTSVSVGAVFVPKVSARQGIRFDGTLPVFLRQARVVAEDRMKLVKNMSKIDETLRRLVEKGQSKMITTKLTGGLRWCYGDLTQEELDGEL